MACCENITPMDYAFSQYMGQVLSSLDDYICNAEHNETYGQASEVLNEYDMMNDIYYMFTYAWLAKTAQDIKIQNASLGVECADVETIRKDIWKEYKFDCMVDYFKCKHHLDLESLLSPLGLNYGYNKGIDFMRIENTDPCVPPFKIV